MLTHGPTQRVVTAPRPWVHGPVADLALGWCWLPVFVLLHAVGDSVTATQSAMLAIFVLSFAHQPLTLGLVYGDVNQLNARRTFYRWAPMAAAAAVLIGLSISLTLVALVAALWNAEHTLMQRFGLLRIYGRKAGDDHGRIERSMLIVWLLTALFFLGAYVDLFSMGARIGVDRTNLRGIELLDSISGVAAVLFWIGAAASLALAAMWVRAERRSLPSTAQRAKSIYAASTFGVLLAVMIDPLAGIGGYVAAHAIEYFAIVDGSIRRRASNGDTSTIVRAARTRRRRTALYVLYIAVLALWITATYTRFDGRVYGFSVLFLGALHILYDGFVWKLRQPSVAASLGITAPVRPPS